MTHDDLFTYMAQRDDAAAAGDETESAYWRGYIDGIADQRGLTRHQLAEVEAGYQLMQVEAAHSMDAAAAAARRRQRT